MSVDPVRLADECIRNFEQISKYEEGNSVIIRSGNIEVGEEAGGSSDWKEIAKKLEELNKHVQTIITAANPKQENIAELLEQMQKAKAGLERISQFYQRQAHPEKMEEQDVEVAAKVFHDNATQLVDLAKRLFSKEQTELSQTAFETIFRGRELSLISPKEKEGLESRESWEELPVVEPRRRLKRTGKHEMAKAQMTVKAMGTLPKPLIESIEQVVKFPEFIAIIGSLLKFSEGPEFKLIDEKEQIWLVTLPNKVELKLDTPEMGEETFILNNSIKIRLSEGRIEFLDRPLQIRVKTPPFEEVKRWYSGEKWWNVATETILGTFYKMAPDFVTLNVNSMRMEGENIIFDLSVILKGLVMSKLAKKLPEIQEKQTLKDFLESLKGIRM